MHRIYTLTEEAVNEGLDWDRAIAKGEIKTVEEFETYEEAVTAFENKYIDDDVYGME